VKNQQRSPDFRPNPERCVFLSEAIDQTTLDRLIASRRQFFDFTLKVVGRSQYTSTAQVGM
jgi:predicted RNA-binding protein YlxR (DUF448 family)